MKNLPGDNRDGEIARQPVPKDTRPWKTRLLQASPCVFLCVFSWAVFGPVDFFFRNAEGLSFKFGDLLPPSLLLALICSALIILLLSCFRGRLFDYMVCGVFAIGFASFVQRNFLNPAFPLMEGKAIDWSAYYSQMIVNSVVWLVLLAIPFVARHFILQAKSGVSWTKAQSVLSTVLAGILFVSLFPYFSSPAFTLGSVRDYKIQLLLPDERFTVSTQGNTIILILDATSGQLAEEAMDAFPEFYDAFKDFTFYRNYSYGYSQTQPSLTSIMTHHPFEMYMNHHFYLNEAWNTDKTRAIYGALHTAGYENLFYSHRGNFGSGSELMGIADNTSSGSANSVHTGELLRQMMKVSAFQFVPLALKPLFWGSTADFEEIVSSNNGDMMRNWRFIDLLQEQGLTTQDHSKAFIVNHIYGAHPPLDTDEYGRRMEQQSEESYLKIQVSGALRGVEEYLAQLKELGVYDDANIVVMGDHALTWTYPITRNPGALMLVKESGESHGEMVWNQAPVTHLELLPTLLHLSGIDPAQFGEGFDNTFYDIDENAERERTVFVMAHDALYPEAEAGYNVMREYHFTGHVDDFLMSRQQENGHDLLEGQAIPQGEREIYPVAVHLPQENPE